MMGILDYGMGNLGSVRQALERIGSQAKVVGRKGEIAACDALVIPGVGSFNAAMKKLYAFQGEIKEFAYAGRPVLGVCLGMQVLFERGSEGGNCSGLGLLEGNVEKLRARKLPHVGWNQANAKAGSKLFEGVAKDSWFYFVHSYACNPYNKREIAATTDYQETFVSAVESKNVFGVQFHPEKSGTTGEKLLKNFSEMI